MGLVFDDTETDMDELTHGGAESRHFALAAGDQAFVESPNIGVVANGDHCGHVGRVRRQP